MRSLVVALVLVVAVSRASAQPAPDLTVDAATRSKVIEGALATLTRYYVFPDVAAKINMEVRRRVAAKKYDGVTSGRAFAELLTSDLRAVNHDPHIGVEFSVEPVPDRKVGLKLTPAQREQLHRRFTFSDAGFVKAERLAGNVGYLRFDAFAPSEEAATRIAAAMSLLADTGALIIDLRSNGGGWPLTVSLLTSYLFPAEEEHHLYDLYSRFDGTTHQYWTSIEVSGKRYTGKPVYVLTSAHTFSAAEGFAYGVQALRRATIIGEVTGGGAHPSLVEKLDTNFLLVVPDARVINTVTHTDWEGTGVKPDVAVPADRALDVAYLAALNAVKPAIDSKLEPDAAKEIDEAIAKLPARDEVRLCRRAALPSERDQNFLLSAPVSGDERGSAESAFTCCVFDAMRAAGLRIAVGRYDISAGRPRPTGQTRNLSQWRTAVHHSPHRGVYASSVEHNEVTYGKSTGDLQRNMAPCRARWRGRAPSRWARAVTDVARPGRLRR